MDRESLKIKTETQLNERAKETNLVLQDDVNFEVNGLKMEILVNHRNAFDDLKFKARFSNVLTKYDYIVGDVAAGQLRLKGFYQQANNSANRINSINNVEEYLLEFINFGAPYFILLNKTPMNSKTDFELPITSNDGNKKRRNLRNSNEKSTRVRSKNTAQKNNNQENSKPSEDKKIQKNRTNRRKKKPNVQKAEIKETKKVVTGENKGLKNANNKGSNVSTKQKNQRKRHFTIHQKDDK